MKLTSRILLLPLCAAVLSAGAIACSSDKKESATATPPRAATTAASPAAAASSTPVAAAPVAATATVAAPAPANTPIPPPPPPANTPVPPPPPPANTPVPPPPAPPAASALSVTIADFNFTGALTGKAGQPITISVRNNGPSTHTFSIQNGPSSGNVAAGASATVQYTLPASPGGVRYFCMIHGGMQGTITVTN